MIKILSTKYEMLKNIKIPMRKTGMLGQCHFEAPFPLVVMPGQRLDKSPLIYYTIY
jgi:hypothetical protein